MLYRTDLRLGEVFYLLIFDNISNSWLLLLNGFEFIFVRRDSATRELRKRLLVLYFNGGYEQGISAQ